MKKLLTVTFFTALLTLLRMLSGFVIAKVIAVYAGPTGMAALGQFQSITSLFTGVCNAPVTTGLVRYTAENDEKGVEHNIPWWRACAAWSMIFIIPSSILCIICSRYLSSFILKDASYYYLFVVLGLLLPFSTGGTAINSVLNGKQLYKKYVTIGMVAVILSSVTMCALIIYKNIQGALLAASVQSGLIGLTLILCVWRSSWLKFEYWFGNVDKKQFKAIGAYLIMAVVSAVTMPLVIFSMRSILIEHAGWTAAGQWQAVWKISEMYLSVITLALGTYYMPRLAKISKFSDVKKEVLNTLSVIIPLLSVISLIIFFMKDIIISILFTKEFNAARELFGIQLIGDVLKIGGWILAYPLLARAKVKWFVGIEIISGFIFVGLAYICVINFKAQGLNIAYVVNYIVYILILTSFYNKIMNPAEEDGS